MVATMIAGLLILTLFKAKAATETVITERYIEDADSSKTVKNIDSTSDDRTFTKAEVPAEFPGGLEGWRMFLESNLKYPKKAMKHGTQGIVKIQMVIDREGNILECRALNDPGDGLAEEAVRVIKKGPLWIPAKQNGRAVRYTFIQTITFQLQ